METILVFLAVSLAYLWGIQCGISWERGTVAKREALRLKAAYFKGATVVVESLQSKG